MPDPLSSPSGALPAALSVRHLSRSYAETRAVSDLSFEIARGQILGLIGPNGAGKTTTLRSIAGVLPLREGAIEICGASLEGEEKLAKRAMAWVPEDPTPFDSLTVWEHLQFTGALYRVPDWRERAERLLAQFELEPKRGALGGELSRGMRQKLAFCCAWLTSPRLLLLDEPLSGLDPRGIRSAKESVRQLAREGTAVLLSSHLLDIVEELCDRILILHRGRAVFDGTLAEARTRLRRGEGSRLEEIFFEVTGDGGELPRSD